MRKTLYQGSELSPTKMFELEAQRTNHLRNLQTIYRQRQAIRQKSEQEVQHRKKKLLSYHRNRQADTERRNRSFQDKINYQNAILRNKLLSVMYSKKNIPENSFPHTQKNHITQLQLTQKNAIMYNKLNNMKCSVPSSEEIIVNTRKVNEYVEMIQKQSPKKKAYLKKLAKKKRVAVEEHNFDPSLDYVTSLYKK